MAFALTVAVSGGLCVHRLSVNDVNECSARSEPYRDPRLSLWLIAQAQLSLLKRVFCRV